MNSWWARAGWHVPHPVCVSSSNDVICSVLSVPLLHLIPMASPVGSLGRVGQDVRKLRVGGSRLWNRQR